MKKGISVRCPQACSRRLEILLGALSDNQEGMRLSWNSRDEAKISLSSLSATSFLQYAAKAYC